MKPSSSRRAFISWLLNLNSPNSPSLGGKTWTLAISDLRGLRTSKRDMEKSGGGTPKKITQAVGARAGSVLVRTLPPIQRAWYMSLELRWVVGVVSPCPACLRGLSPRASENAAAIAIGPPRHVQSKGMGKSSTTPFRSKLLVILVEDPPYGLSYPQVVYLPQVGQ